MSRLEKLGLFILILAAPAIHTPGGTPKESLAIVVGYVLFQYGAGLWPRETP